MTRDHGRGGLERQVRCLGPGGRSASPRCGQGWSPLGSWERVTPALLAGFWSATSDAPSVWPDGPRPCLGARVALCESVCVSEPRSLEGTVMPDWGLTLMILTWSPAKILFPDTTSFRSIGVTFGGHSSAHNPRWDALCVLLLPYDTVQPMTDHLGLLLPLKWPLPAPNAPASGRHLSLGTRRRGPCLICPRIPLI